MLKKTLLVCGATLLLAASGLAGTSDDAMPGDEAQIQRQGDETPDLENEAKSGRGSEGRGTSGNAAMGANEEPLGDDSGSDPGEGRQPGDTTSGAGDERGSGDTGTLGSGATGEDGLDADQPAE